jgi:hypothetical protein
VSSNGITREELQLAARNHGMPLEVLRWPVTPVGMHYLLIHYDVPLVGDDWTLAVDGNVGTPFTLTLDELRGLPAHEVVATMECAGNGRAKYTPRPLSQPWLDEAIGTGRWRGSPSASRGDHPSCRRSGFAPWVRSTSLPPLLLWTRPDFCCSCQS